MRTVIVLVLSLVFVSLIHADLANIEAMARKNPNDVRLKFLLGKAYSQQGDHLKAKTVFQRILQKRRAPVVFLHLGLELAAMGNLTGAILQWTSVIEQKPNSKTAMRLLARALYKQALQLTNERDQADLFEQSLGWWKRILHLDPGNLRARYYAGIQCYKLGRFEEAAKHWLILLRVKKNNRKTLKGLAKALIKLGHFEKAQRVAKRVLAIEGKLGRTGYTAWARALLKKIASGDIKKPTVRRKEEDLGTLVRVEPEPDLSGPKTQAERDKFLERKKPGPVPPQPPVPAEPPVTGPDLGPSIEAENLFLDGLDFMDQKKYEKALFAFLQSIDINPNFTQVYLQMGECYIQLARLAKRKTQFVERLALSRQSLEKVKEKSPGSLVSHAAQSKLIILEKLTRSGFKGYHIMTAHKAIKENREDDAFDEYLLLLSNLILEPGVFLEFGIIVPKISKTHLQDLQYFTEDLYQKNAGHPWIEYLLGKIYAHAGQQKAAEDAYNRFLEHFVPKEDPNTFEIYVKFIDYPKVANVDRYLGVRLLIKIGKKKEAAELLKLFLKHAAQTDIFYKEASLLADQLRRARRTSQGMVSFKDEVQEVQQKVEAARVLLDPTNLSPSHLDERLLKSMELFTDEAPDNSFGRFVYAWVMGHLAQTAPGNQGAELRKRSEELFHEVLSEKTASAEWHYKMGLQALHWRCKDRGMAHLKLVGDILLARGISQSAPYCNKLLVEAEHFEGLGKHDVSSALLRQAKILSSRSLNYYLVRAWMEYRRGNPLAAIGQFVDWSSSALTESWVRRILFCDIGLAFFLAVLATILATATALTAKYFDMLHHFFVEFVTAKGAILTVGLAVMAAIFLFFFSTGLIVFLPAILWPLMTDRERLVYVVLVCLLLLVPLLLPVSLFDNFELVRQVENVRSGDLESARPFFKSRAAASSLDFGSNYAYGLICLRDGSLDEAQKLFSSLAQQGEHEGILINLGVLAARKGQYSDAISHFQKALSIEAKSIPALFNISAVYSFQGHRDKAEQYLRWAKSLATDAHQLPRYRGIPSSVAKLVLMDSPLDIAHFDSHFSFFSTENFFRLNANLIGFITWFVIGGGLIGFLLFQRERMDIVPGRCSQCYRAACNLCQQIIDSKAHCELCAARRDEGVAEETLKTDRREIANEKRDWALKRAYLLGTVLPGTGPLFTGDALPSVCCQLGFWFTVQAAMGGWLLSFAFAHGPGADALSFFSWLLWAGALFFFLLGLVLLHRRKEGIEWI